MVKYEPSLISPWHVMWTHLAGQFREREYKFLWDKLNDPGRTIFGFGFDLTMYK